MTPQTVKEDWDGTGEKAYVLSDDEDREDANMASSSSGTCISLSLDPFLMNQFGADVYIIGRERRCV
jgi:hypothetical protein